MLETPYSPIPRSGKVMEIGQSAAKSFGYILGVYLGDGCVALQVSHKSGDATQWYPAFRVNTIDEDFALAIKVALADLTDRSITIHKHSVKLSTKPNYGLRCGSPELCKKLVDDTDSKKVIPAYVWEWPKEVKLAFIAGLMDSEGFVTKNHKTGTSYYMGFKCCEAWVPDFVRLLESVGVMTGKLSVCPPYKAHYKSPMRFHIKMNSWVKQGAYFKIQRKQARIEEWNARRLCSETNMPDAAIAR